MLNLFEQLIMCFNEQETEKDKWAFCDELGEVLRNFERELENKEARADLERKYRDEDNLPESIEAERQENFCN